MRGRAPGVASRPLAHYRRPSEIHDPEGPMKKSARRPEPARKQRRARPPQTLFEGVDLKLLRQLLEDELPLGGLEDMVDTSRRWPRSSTRSSPGTRSLTTPRRSPKRTRPSSRATWPTTGSKQATPSTPY